MSVQDINAAAIAENNGEEKRLVLVGQPNVGKSKIFSLLTGQYVIVSNYPGTTVEISSGKATELDYHVVDTPGIGGVVPRSEEELVALQTLLTDHVAAILQVGDAKNLRRTLLLTLALIETGLPLVLDLNMADEAEKKGYRVDMARLSRSLGFPVAMTVATEGRGKKELLDSLRRPARSPIRIIYDTRVEVAALQIARSPAGLSHIQEGHRPDASVGESLPGGYPAGEARKGMPGGQRDHRPDAEQGSRAPSAVDHECQDGLCRKADPRMPDTGERARVPITIRRFPGPGIHPPAVGRGDAVRHPLCDL